MLNLDIIYGDTDSIMINTHTKDLAEVKRKAKELKEAINKNYSELEIDLDGIFLNMLLLKKKKYASLVVTEANNAKGYTTRRNMKGIDMVRRDWCPLSATMGSYVLDQILSENVDRENVLVTIHEYLKSKAEEIRASKIPLKEFLITKSITKNPEQYADKQTYAVKNLTSLLFFFFVKFCIYSIFRLPHVQVALAMKRAGKPVQPGDFIQYLICTGDKPVALRAFSLEQVHNFCVNFSHNFSSKKII